MVHIPKLWKENIIKEQRGYCAGKNCARLHRGRKMKVDMYSQFDHIRPTGMDGKNIPSNIQALCPGCHSAKTREDRLRIKKWKEKHNDNDIWKPPKFKPPKFKF